MISTTERILWSITFVWMLGLIVLVLIGGLQKLDLGDMLLGIGLLGLAGFGIIAGLAHTWLGGRE